MSNNCGEYGIKTVVNKDGAEVTLLYRDNEPDPTMVKESEKIFKAVKAMWLYPYRYLLSTKHKKGPRKGRTRYVWAYGQLPISPDFVFSKKRVM